MSDFFCRIIFALYTSLSIISSTDFCLSGSVTNSPFNGNYAEQPNVDSNGNTYYKKCDEYLYQYQLGNNYYWQFSQSVGSNTYNIKCPTSNLASPDLCPSGKWLSGSNSEASINVVNDACFIPQISCSNILLENTKSMDCNGLFTKADDNLYTRQLTSNCGGSGGTKYWYYNERYQRYECSDEDKRDPCQTGINYFTTYSTDSQFESITEGQTDISVNINDASATLSCGVEQENEVIECDNIEVTGSNYCNGIFVKKSDNLYENVDTERFWLQYTYNEFSAAYGKMMCSYFDQSAVCSPVYMGGDIALNAGLPNLETGSASFALSSGTATFTCNVANSAGNVIGFNGDNSVINGKEYKVTATATFEASDSGVDGTVKVDENGNVFINLDVSKLDTEACNFGENDDIVLEYGIYNKGTECSWDNIGDIYNPFNVPKCSKYNGNGDKYFECSIGDLSGRFGDAMVDNNHKIVIEGNVSEEG
eukprot:773506_1